MEGVIALFFEQRVTLLEQDIVGIQAVEILFVVLRDNYIEKSPPLVAAVFYQSPVLRTDHHQRQQSDMVNHPFVVFLPVAKLLLLPALHPAGNGNRLKTL